jgi:hypothetical protein
MNATHALGQFLLTLPHSAAATFLALSDRRSVRRHSDFLFDDFFVDG